MQYGQMRWVDIEALDKDATVVVCPLASLEQHGHHLPLLTDTYLVSEVANRLEAAMPKQVVLTPTLWLGASDHHLDFPGTISVPNTLYVDMITSILRSFVDAGFQRILFLNGHGGNIAPGTVALTEAVNENDDFADVFAVLSSYWTVAEPCMRPADHGMESERLTHACEYETSMMLAIKHELVHLGDAMSTPPVIDSPFFHSEQGGRVMVANRFSRLTESGSMGNPQAATREKGESLLNAIGSEVLAFVKEFLTWKPLRQQKWSS